MKKLEKKCVFFHGLGGEPSEAIEYLMGVCGYEVICEHVDYYVEWYKDRGKSYCERSLALVEGVDLILGNSFGAHPAYLMAKATGIDLLLINPAVNRARSTTGIGAYVMNIEEEKKPRIEVFFGELDNVVLKEYTIEFFEQTGDEYSAFIVKNMEHGMAYHDFNAMLQASEIVDKPVKKFEKPKLEETEETK